MLISRNIALRALLLGAIGCQAVDAAPATAGDTTGVATDASDTAVSDVSTDASDIAALDVETNEPDVAAPDVGPEPSCENPAPVLLASGQPTGLVRCADGTVNRVAAGTFEPENTAGPCLGDETTKDCAQDADCTGGSNGRCVHRDLGETFCNCEYACATDADCGAGTACVPADVTTWGRPTCAPASCKTAADCPSGECGLADSHNGCWELTELRCRDSATDKCRSDVDCTELGVAYTCDNAEAGRAFECVAPNCDIGRSLLVGGVARVAPTVRRSGWGAAA